MNISKFKTFQILSIWLLFGLIFAPFRSSLATPQTQPANRQNTTDKGNLFSANPDPESKIEPLLLKELARSSQVDFFIWLTEKADLSPAANLLTKEAKGQFVFDTLRETAERTQKELRVYLDSQGIVYRPYYIANKILVRGGNQNLLLSVAARSDVARITANHRYQLEEPKVHPEGKAPVAPETVEGNIEFVNADDVWGLGFTGQGTVLAANDTGLDWDHPALINQYRGWNGIIADHNYNWWDATGTYPTAPGDGFGHGTHVSGTMVGDDGGTNQIGMAPGAKIVHCKNLDDFGSGDDSTISECFEWDLAPWDLNGQNPNPALAPDAINNSWGYSGGGYPVMEDEITALQAAGILVEVSAGNDGPGCQTLGSPGDYGEVLTTGSVGWTGGSLPGSLTWFSSRGPSTLSPDYLPDVMAPGENIRSSLPGGGYQAWDGTSMSGPHVTGLIGLLWAANPGLEGLISETHQIIQLTTVPLTGQTGSSCGGDYDLGPNNDWGYGTIDALAAVQAALLFGGPGTLTGTVTDSSTSDPIPGVLIKAALTPALGWQTTTNQDGQYTRVVFSGTYTVTASTYGYYPNSTAGVQVIEDQTTTHDIQLDLAPLHLVSGVVTDAATGWPLYARIDIQGYPFGPVWTDPLTGQYSIDLAAGSPYTFKATPFVAGYQTEFRSVGPLDAPQTEDFALLADAVACEAPGYMPDYVYFEDFEQSDGGYTVEGDSSWAWGVPTSGPKSAHSGQNVWATNLTGNYSDNEFGMLTSPDMDMSAYAGETLILSWWQWLETETYFDYAWVEVSNDGGSSWSTVYGPVDGSVDKTWTKHNIVLDSFYAVSNFRVRFVLQSDFIFNFAGFYVDDIGVGVAIQPPTLYTEDFEANDGSFAASGTVSWEWGTPIKGPTEAHSGVNVWGTDLDNNYRNNEDSTITSPVIDLTAGTGENLLLSWWQWLQTESAYDFASVEITNNGITWTQVYTASGIITFAAQLPLGGGGGGWVQAYSELDSSYATSDFQIRFNLQSDGSITYPGFYVDDLNIDVFVAIPPAVPCNQQPGGLLVGYVLDENTGKSLNGASVSSSASLAQSNATPADPAVEDGFYTLFAFSGTHPITATLSGGYGSDVQTPEVPLGDAVWQDFQLPAGLLSASPDSLSSTLTMGNTDTKTFDLNNLGGLPAFYTVQERDSGFLPTAWVSTLGLGAQPTGITSAQAPTGHTSMLTLSSFNNPENDELVCVFKDLDPWGTIEVENFLAANSISYAIYTSSDFATLDFSLCQSIVFSSDQPQSFYDAYELHTEKFHEYVEGGGFLNFFSADAGWNGGFLYTSLPGGVVWNPFYSDVNEIDDPAHPVVQGVPNPFYGSFASHGNFSNLPDDAHIIAHDTYTGEPTIVEYPLGSGAVIAFGQPLEVAHAWGWELGLIMENTLLWGLTYTPPDVPWLETTPISGTLSITGTQILTVMFDASVPEITQPGIYNAELRVKNDTPYGTLILPVTMNVNPPAGWGRLSGTVIGLGYCDADGVPLNNASVDIQSVAATQSDATGEYIYWMPAGTYDVTVSNPGYVSQTFSVDISSASNTVQNVDLRLDAPCSSASPSSFEVTVTEGYSTTTVLSIDNTGAVTVSFNLLESLLHLEPVGGGVNIKAAAAVTPLAVPASGPASALTLANSAIPGPSGIETPLAGWFGATDHPEGIIRYAFAQCFEQPESYYVFGGVNGSFNLAKAAWRYDATSNAWTKLTDMPAGYEASSAACYQGKIFVMGGSGSTDMFIYNIGANTWSLGAPLPRGVEGAAAAAWDGKVYLIGGDDDFSPGTGVSDEVNVYDIATDIWLVNGTSMPVAAGNAGFAQVGPSLFVVGGWGEIAPSANISTTLRYDLENDSWETGPAFTSSRADFALAATDGALFAIGGDKNKGGFFDGVKVAERLDLSTWPAGGWAAIDNLPVALQANQAGFCTSGLFDASVPEIWSVGGLDTSWFIITGRTLFQEKPGESCYSIYTDVDWLSFGTPSGTVPGGVTAPLEVMVDASSLKPGQHTATIAIVTNDQGNPLIFIPITVTVETYVPPTEPYELFLPVLYKH